MLPMRTEGSNGIYQSTVLVFLIYTLYQKRGGKNRIAYKQMLLVMKKLFQRYLRQEVTFFRNQHSQTTYPRCSKSLPFRQTPPQSKSSSVYTVSFLSPFLYFLAQDFTDDSLKIIKYCSFLIKLINALYNSLYFR